MREIKYDSKGATLTTEDGDVYTAEYVILTVSLGVLQSQLIDFKPDLPVSYLRARDYSKVDRC